MADKVLSVKIKQRYDTESNWSANNPVLLSGEMAISSDRNGMYKTGNGTSTWSQLPYNNANAANTATTASKLGSSTVGSAAKPIYLNSGTATACSSTVGSADTPVYMNGGTITSTGKSFSSYLPLSGGTMTNPNNILFSNSTNTAITPNASSILQSSISKYLWHDLFSFGNYSPTYQTTTDGTTWTNGTTNLKLFAQKENQSVPILTSTIIGARWTFTGVNYNSANYIVIGFSYSNPSASTTITVEYSTDNSTWTTIRSSSGKYSALPVWFYISSVGNYKYLRLTLSKASSDTGLCNLNSIKCLTSRWGDQGGGSELEYPYSWDENKNITISGNLTVNGNINGNASTASKLANARTIALTGSITGSGTFDGSGNLSIATSTNHSHNYAGSSSAGGSATSAVKLDSSAGSATQPVYFSGGKPVACSYTLGKSVPSNAVFTDTNTKVTQTVTTSNASYPLLLAPNGQTATTTTTSYFDSGVTLNPSTNTIVANISGNAATSTKATQDSAGQQINKTYIKGLSVSGRTITYTKGDGTTGTITTQDNNTTYSAATTSTNGLLSYSSNVATTAELKTYLGY